LATIEKARLHAQAIQGKALELICRKKAQNAQKRALFWRSGHKVQ